MSGHENFDELRAQLRASEAGRRAAIKPVRVTWTISPRGGHWDISEATSKEHQP